MNIRLGVTVALLLARPSAAGPVRAQGVPAGGGVMVLEWSGGAVEQLTTEARRQGCTPLSAWVTLSGQFVGYVYGAPAFVNARFAALAPGLAIRPGTVILRCGAPPAVAAPATAPRVAAPPPATAARGTSFLETFTGAPTSPQPFVSPNWDVVVHSRNRANWDELSGMDMQHGPDCGAPPATHPGSGRYEDAVFRCRDHVMTAITEGGYGLVYLTPNVMADWSAGEAVISFDISTHQTSGAGRDWFDLWLTPFAGNLSLPLPVGDGPDLQGPPHNALHLKMRGDNGAVRVCPTLFANFADVPLPACVKRGWDNVLTPSSTVRSTIEVRVSRTHLKVWMPQFNLVWFDADIPALAFSQAVVQFGHHSYNPTKSDDGYCEDGPPPCHGNTWHWDNMSISPAAPFTIVHSDRRYVDGGTTGAVNFTAPAPSASFLRFSGAASIEVSFDGTTWIPAQLQAELTPDDGNFHSYWMPVPEGTQSV